MGSRLKGILILIILGQLFINYTAYEVINAMDDRMDAISNELTRINNDKIELLVACNNARVDTLQMQRDVAKFSLELGKGLNAFRLLKTIESKP